MRDRLSVFLCHASENKDVACHLAESFIAAGIDVFYDDWDIRAGDSLRSKIDSGLEGCTHFVALLTPESVQKPWVQTEMDAAFVRKVEGACRFIPLRLNVDLQVLPPLLRGLYSPSLDNDEAAVQRLIGDIYEVSRKPPLGPVPLSAQPGLNNTHGFSVAATKIILGLVTRSEQGRHGDPQLKVEELLAVIQLSPDDFQDAVEELENAGLAEALRAVFCPPFGYFAVQPTARLFVEFDLEIKGWDPLDDARQIAAEIVGNDKQIDIPRWAEQRDWLARRANPALTLLMEGGWVNHSDEVSWPFVTVHLWRNVRTRRFLKEHS